MDFCDLAKRPWGLIRTSAQPWGLSGQVPIGTISREDSSRIVLLLSWYIVVISTCCPCAAKKFLVHSTWPIMSSTATSSASVELLVFNFCLHDTVFPVWLFMSGCTMYERSNHHFASSSGSVFSVMSCVFLMYFLCIVSLLSAFCSRQCLVLSLWYIEKLLLFVCPVLSVCSGIVV